MSIWGCVDGDLSNNLGWTCETEVGQSKSYFVVVGKSEPYVGVFYALFLSDDVRILNILKRRIENVSQDIFTYE